MKDESLEKVLSRTNENIRKRGYKMLKKPSDFTGPIESSIPFDEGDLVTMRKVPEFTNVPGYGDIISGAGNAASESIRNATQSAQNKEELRLAKKRRIAEMLARGMKRDTNFYRLGTEVGDENADNQASAIQDVARGFAESYRR